MALRALPPPGPEGFREPPHSIEAEQALLGALLCDNRAVEKVRFLKPESFYEPAHQRVFERMLALIEGGRPADPITTARLLIDDGKLPGNPREYLASIMRASETIVDPTAYAIELQDLAARRALVRAGEDAVNAAYDLTAQPTPELIADLSGKLQALQQQNQASLQFEYIEPSFIGQDLPPQRFLIDRWVPIGSLTSLYGSGGTGKSFLATMAAMCAAAKRDWLGFPCQQASVLAVMCEDDEDEIKRRVNQIAEALEITEQDLGDRLHITARVGSVNALMEFPGGIATRTSLFEQIIAEAKRLNAQLIILDNAGQLFAGNENDRSQVTAFLNACAGIARAIDGAVLLLGHPSKTKDMEYSGSTAWDAVVRSRLMFKRVEEEGSEGRYTLELLKTNRGKRFGIELAINGKGIVENVGEIEPGKKRRPGNDEKTFNALSDLFATHRRAITLDEIVTECIRRGILIEAAPDGTAPWRDRRRTVRKHLLKHEAKVDARDDDSFALKPA